MRRISAMTASMAAEPFAASAACSSTVMRRAHDGIVALQPFGTRR